MERRILQYQKTTGDTVNDNASDTVKPGCTTSRLIAVIGEHPDYTYDEYAQALGIGRATVARHIKKQNGTVIHRIGSDKDGCWEIIKDWIIGLPDITKGLNAPGPIHRYHATADEFPAVNTITTAVQARPALEKVER